MARSSDSRERSDRKKRLSVYLDPELMRLLADFADRREQSRSIVAEAAIASFLSPDADERQEAAIGKRLERIIQRLERDLGIANISIVRRVTDLGTMQKQRRDDPTPKLCPYDKIVDHVIVDRRIVQQEEDDFRVYLLGMVLLEL